MSVTLLALETAGEACSAALWRSGALSERFRVAPREHTRLLIPMVDELLAEGRLALEDIDALAYGRGPGSFTGLRIAAAVVQGLSLGAARPVVPVSSLAAMALGAMDEHGWQQVAVCQDARMGEVYWGLFRQGADGLPEPVEGDRLQAPEGLTLPGPGPWFGTGSGWAIDPGIGDRLAPVLAGTEGRPRYPHAADIARLAVTALGKGASVGPEDALPVYLRDEVARKSQ